MPRDVGSQDHFGPDRAGWGSSEPDRTHLGEARRLTISGELQAGTGGVLSARRAGTRPSESLET